jgi:hypothetical protein
MLARMARIFAVTRADDSNRITGLQFRLHVSFHYGLIDDNIATVKPTLAAYSAAIFPRIEI